jgi:hypothetical protein
MRPRTIPFAVLVFGIFAFACVRPSLDELPVSEHAGHYTFGASSSWFWACGAAAADSSWVTFTDRAVAQRDSIQRTGALSTGERYFVRWRAAVTSGGEVGPRGPGVPALLVREILVLRPAAAGDCR